MTITGFFFAYVIVWFNILYFWWKASRVITSLEKEGWKLTWSRIKVRIQMRASGRQSSGPQGSRIHGVEVTHQAGLGQDPFSVLIPGCCCCRRKYEIDPVFLSCLLVLVKSWVHKGSARKVEICISIIMIICRKRLLPFGSSTRGFQKAQIGSNWSWTLRGWHGQVDFLYYVSTKSVGFTRVHKFSTLGLNRLKN